MEIQRAPSHDAPIELQSVDPADSADGTRSTVAPADQERYPTGVRFIILTVGLILSIFLSALDASIIATSIPKITDQFGTVKDVGWYGAGYSLTNAAFQSSWGKAYKYFPLVSTFTAAVVVFELGNLICALAPSSATLILGRIIAGVGGGGVMTGCFIIIAFSTKPKYRAAYMGVLGVTFGCASVVGPLLGGFLTDGPGWPWCFWISLPIGAFAVVLLALTLERPPTAARPVQSHWKVKLVSLDLVGACLVLASMTSFVLALQGGGIAWSWNNWRAITSLTVSGVVLILFIINEWFMGDRAMIQAHLFKKRTLTGNLVFMFCLSGLYTPLTYSLPIQFQSVDNASASESGVRLIPLLLGVSVFTMVANGILTYRRRYTPFLILGAMFGTIGLVLVHTLGPDAPVGRWIAYELLIGIGVGISLQVPMIANQSIVGVEDMAAVTSLTLFVENVAMSIFRASTEAAFINGLIKSLAHNAPHLSPVLVVDTGVTKIRETFESEDIAAVLRSYMDGCKDSHLVPMASGASALAVSMLLAIPTATRTWRSQVRKLS